MSIKSWLKDVWSGPLAFTHNDRPIVVEFGDMDIAIIEATLEHLDNEPCVLLRKMKKRGPWAPCDVNQTIGRGDILFRFKLNTTSMARFRNAIDRCIDATCNKTNGVDK